VVETVSKGKIVRAPDKPDRLFLKRGENLAILKLTRDGNRESWVLTGYERKKFDANFNLRKLTGPIFFKGK
jgi:hypothetical protein